MAYFFNRCNNCGCKPTNCRPCHCCPVIPTGPTGGITGPTGATGARSEERRVGKECGHEWRSRWSPYQ